MYKGRLYVISSRKTPDDFYLEDSGQYDSGLSWSWALFTAWAFGFKFKFYTDVEFKKPV